MTIKNTVNNKINITQLVDNQVMNRFQIRTVLLCALIAFLDGVDTQSIGVAAPFIINSLHVTRSALGPIFSAAILGAMIGALTMGYAGDRFGRKRVLMFSMLVFGAGTVATAFATSYESLLAIRLVTGIGLGGATPCFLALASEYTPARRRAAITSALWAAFPLGGMLGGFLNSWLITRHGWQFIFIAGGIAPVALILLIWFLLPESPSVLINRANAASSRSLARIVGQLTGLTAPVKATFAIDQEKIQSASFRLLFIDGRARSTLLLSLPFIMAFGTLAVIVLWTPALLRDSGMTAADTAIAIGYHGLGALIGMGSAGRLIERFGATRVLVPAMLLGALSTAAVGVSATSLAMASLALALTGVFVGLSASGAIALAVLMYPAAIRSSGIGWQMGMGRMGQVLAPLLTGLLLSLGIDGGKTFFYVALAPMVGAVAIFLIAQRKTQAAGDAASGLAHGL
jgi:AAHS family 4-hydroxybenzoate transporter-like MFS transporter